MNTIAKNVANEPTAMSITPKGLAKLANMHPNTKPRPYLGSINANKTNTSDILNCICS